MPTKMMAIDRNTLFKYKRFTLHITFSNLQLFTHSQ